MMTGYAVFIAELKERVQRARLQASLAVNRELILLYWEIGCGILDQQKRRGWGAKVIDRLASDLGRAFPDMKGFSPRNLKYMRAFAQACDEKSFVQQVAAQIPWFHHCVLLDKVKDKVERQWYLCGVVTNGWSRNVLVHQIESGLYQRQGKEGKTTNFPRTLPPARSDLAEQLLKYPYQFDFLALSAKTRERELERGLVAHIREFLLELGVGFSFVASQFRLPVGGEDYYIDLLFYHLALRCYIAIEIKIGEFKPEYAGKMNFYLTALDRQMKRSGDHSSIGIILCKAKDKVVVEYALLNIQKPIGIATYQLTATLPRGLRSSLPTLEQLESELT